MKNKWTHVADLGFSVVKKKDWKWIHRCPIHVSLFCVSWNDMLHGRKAAFGSCFVCFFTIADFRFIKMTDKITNIWGPPWMLPGWFFLKPKAWYTVTSLIAGVWMCPAILWSKNQKEWHNNNTEITFEMLNFLNKNRS